MGIPGTWNEQELTGRTRAKVEKKVTLVKNCVLFSSYFAGRTGDVHRGWFIAEN
jgi:hypothetical protein